MRAFASSLNPRKRERHLTLRFALSIGLACFALSASAERVTVTLDQAHRLGRVAFEQRNYPLAYRVAEELLKAQPDDLPALMLLAASAPHIDKAKDGRLAGRKAYLKAQTPNQKLNAATYAAVAAAKEKRPLLTQLWLRRAYQQSQTEAQRANIAKQYRKYARTSPVRLSFSATVSPSSNLNGGAESRFLVIDGVFPVGVLSGSAQALSGTRATVSGRLSYTLSESPTHKTALTLSGSFSRVRLSNDAKAQAPDIDNSDLADTQVSARLVHQIASRGRPIPDTYTLALGQTWFGGETYYTYGTLGLGRQMRLGDQTLLSLGAEYTHQSFETRLADKGITTLRFGVAHRLKRGDVLQLGLSLNEGNSDDRNSNYQSFYATLGYQLGKPVGPATLAASIGYGETTYDDYRLGFISVPGGRKDEITRVKLDVTFKDVSYLGFVPQMNISHIRTQSNVSRFERKTTGVGLSFVSAF